MILVLKIFLMLMSNAHAYNFETAKTDFLSPIETEAKWPLAIGAGLTLTVLIFEDSIVDPTQKEFIDDKPIGSLSRVGDLAGQVIPNALYFIGQSIAGFSGSEKGYQRASGMARATFYPSLVTTALKYTVREPRPNSRNRNSFPSGHSTTAFAFSGYVFAEHDLIYGIPAVALSTLTALSRINDNQHYLHDVLAGSTIGFAYGMAISLIDKKKAGEKIAPAETTLNFFPIYESEYRGVGLVADF